MPGKALQSIAGTPLVQWVTDAAVASERASDVLVATSTDSADNAIVTWCQDRGVKCLTGPLHDVLGRLASIASAISCDAIVRVSGDSPLIDPCLIDYAIDLFSRGGFDMVTNVQTRSFPKGQSVEVIATSLLHRLAQMNLPIRYREHVTPAIYLGLVEARTRNFTSREVAPDYVQEVRHGDVVLTTINLSVDTPEDGQRIERVIRFLDPLRPSTAGWIKCTDVMIKLESARGPTR